ncbi:hypothetical protein BaRGS_00023620, partial [Batillaria attramentaria]
VIVLGRKLKSMKGVVLQVNPTRNFRKGATLWQIWNAIRNYVTLCCMFERPVSCQYSAKVRDVWQ